MNNLPKQIKAQNSDDHLELFVDGAGSVTMEHGVVRFSLSVIRSDSESAGQYARTVGRIAMPLEGVRQLHAVLGQILAAVPSEQKPLVVHAAPANVQ